MYFSLLKASKYVGKPKRYPLSPSAISTITNENQVKTYMDNSNGVRNASSNAYNKVRSKRHPVYFVLIFILLVNCHNSMAVCSCMQISQFTLALHFMWETFNIIWDRDWRGYCSKSTNVGTSPNSGRCIFSNGDCRLFIHLQIQTRLLCFRTEGQIFFMCYLLN